MRFWDTSALVPLILEEAHSDRAKALLVEDPRLILWWGAELECQSALARSWREGRIDRRQYDQLRDVARPLLSRAFEISPSATVRSRAIRVLESHPLRAADALHLAAALTWTMDRPAGAELVCLDQRLRSAAQREGFVVLPTGG